MLGMSRGDRKYEVAWTTWARHGLLETTTARKEPDMGDAGMESHAVHGTCTSTVLLTGQAHPCGARATDCCIKYCTVAMLYGLLDSRTLRFTPHMQRETRKEVIE